MLHLICKICKVRRARVVGVKHPLNIRHSRTDYCYLWDSPTRNGFKIRLSFNGARARMQSEVKRLESNSMSNNSLLARSHNVSYAVGN